MGELRAGFLRGILNYLGSYWSVANIAFSWKDGKTYVVSSDDSTLLQYWFENPTPHKNFSIFAADIKGIRFNSRSKVTIEDRQLIVGKHEIKTSKSEEYILSDFKTRAQYVIDWERFVDMYKMAAYVVSSFDNSNATVNIFPDCVIFRSRNEVICNGGIGVLKDISLSFEDIAHLVSFTNSMNLKVLTISLTKDIAIFASDNFMLLTKYNKKPFKTNLSKPLLTADWKSEVFKKLKSSQKCVLHTKTKQLYVNGIKLGEVPEEFNGELESEKAAYFIKRKNVRELIVYRDCILLRNGDADAIFFFN